MNTYADLMYAYGAWAAIRLVHARQSCVKEDLTEVCERRVDLWGKQNSKKKETETTLFRTEATQQKEHTTHNLYIFIRCYFGPLLFALVFAPYICPTIQHRCSHLALYFPMVAALPLNCFTR